MSKSKVALAGATGLLGKHVLNALLDAGHPVVALTRTTSSSTPPSHANLTVAKVDYTSADSMTPHLKGCLAVISALGSSALSTQPTLVDAALAAGVPRFIPSAFGSDNSNALARKLPIFADKVVTEDYLVQKAKENDWFSYTFLYTGPFFDALLEMGFLIGDLKAHKATVYDGGDSKFSATTLPEIGKSVVGVLAAMEETKNEVVYVQNVRTSQNELMKLAGGDWEVTNKKTEQERETGGMMGGLWSAIFAEGYGGDFDGRTSNDTVGVKSWGEEDLEAFVKEVVEKKK